MFSVTARKVQTTKIIKREFHATNEALEFIIITYALPLFLMSLYYNYGWDYGLTGLHLFYPLIPSIPFLLNGHKSRDLIDACQLITGVSILGVGAFNRNYYALLSFLVQISAYYFHNIRGMKFSSKMKIGEAWFNIVMSLVLWLLYLSMLQSFIDTGGRMDYCKLAENSNYPCF